ncbi:hypothetical protein [Sphingobacterium faecium]
MKKLLKLIVFQALVSVHALAQQAPINNKINLPDIQTPQAASLGKYGVYPAAEYTGALPISIPLFEIDARGYKIPFSLSFHGSGVKLNQLETEVGLGWSLSGIGMINRSVVSVPDEKLSGSYNKIPKNLMEIFNAATLPINATQSQISNTLSWLQATASGAGDDTHSDYYFYNFPGHSGKFIVNNKTDYVTIPFAPIKISRGSIDYSNILSPYTFNITDEQGAISTFGSYSYSLPENFDASLNNTVGSWYLDNISIPHKNEQVSFIYEDLFFEEGTRYEEQAIGYHLTSIGALDELSGNIDIKLGKITHRMKLLKEINYGNGKVVFNYMNSPNSTVSLMKFLNEILIFNKSGALIKKIVLNYSVPANRVKLSKVNLIDLQNTANSGTYDLIYNGINFPSRTSLSSDYWGYYNSYGTGLLPFKTVERSSILMSATGEINWINKIYNVGNSNRSVNEATNQAEMLSKIIYPTKGYTQFTFEPNKYRNWEVVSSDKQIQIGGRVLGKGTMTKSEEVYSFVLDSTNMIKPSPFKPKLNITFGPPTPINGAIQEYTQLVTLTDLTTNTVMLTKYHNSNPASPLSISEEVNLIMGHQYALKLTVYGVSSYVNGNMTSSIDAYLTWTSNSNKYGYAAKLGGGLRIKKIDNYDASSNLVNSEEYNYGRDNSGLGDPLFNSNILFKNYQDFQYYTFFVRDPNALVGITERGQYWDRKFFGVSEYSSIGGVSGQIFYDRVTKIINSVSSAENIKEEKIFKLDPEKTYESTDFLNSKNYGSYSYILNDPALSSVKSYNSEGKLIKSKMLDYKYVRFGLFSPALVFEKNIFTNPTGAAAFTLNYNINSDFHFSQSKIQSALRLPSEERETSYFYSNGLLADSTFSVKNTDYLSVYNTEPTEIKIAGSDLKTKIIKIKYPDDVSTVNLQGGDLSTVELQAIQKLGKANEHRPLEPIQVEEYSDSGLLSIDRNLYGDFTGKARLNKNVKKYTNSDFVKNIAFLQYDSYGNPQEIKKQEEPVTTYLWGYGGQYPIAEIKNATYAEVLGILGQATINSLNAVNASETTINNAMDALRNHVSLSNAMVTSYTYQPLVGMKSKTDARGVTEYYEYDGMQRLKAVLDQFKHVTSSMDYHYRPN